MPRTTTTLKTQDVAAMLGVSCGTVRRWAESGALPAERLTPRSPRMFRAADVLRLLERSRSATGQPPQRSLR